MASSSLRVGAGPAATICIRLPAPHGARPCAWHTLRVSAYRHQAHLESPVEVVWDLVATPTRYPEWWPRVVEVRGERFEEGDEYVQVVKSASGSVESNFLLERRDDLRELRMSCELTGAYAAWLLTPAQGGTFVELEMGMQPRRLGYRLVDAAIGRSYFRRWSKQSLEALREASTRESPASLDAPPVR
jgi:uncharacterized protein YndB with AHSA1/START domain